MAGELVFMSTQEIDRVGVIRQVLERRLSRVKAGQLLDLCARQVARLCAAYERDGAAGLASRRRGRVSNRKLRDDVEARVVELVRRLYEDFGPTLAREKLREQHGIKIGKETLRRVLMRAGIWVAKDQRIPKPHQPRFRRECFCDIARAAGAWVHIDGAFGLWAAAAPDRAALVRGFALADSWAIDAHKWLNVPYDSAVAFVRDGEALRTAMTATAAYAPGGDQREPCHHTPEFSRRARGVEIWAALRQLGREGVADLIERSCRQAARMAKLLSAAGYEILNDVVINRPAWPAV